MAGDHRSEPGGADEQGDDRSQQHLSIGAARGPQRDRAKPAVERGDGVGEDDEAGEDAGPPDVTSHDRPHREHRQDDAGASRDSAAGDQSEPARDRQAVGNHRHERGTVVGQRPCEQPQGGQRGDGKDGRQDPEPLEAAAEQGREVEAHGWVHPWDVPGVEGGELGRDESVVAKVQHHHREEAAVAQRKVGEDRRQAHPGRDRQRYGDDRDREP